MVRGLLADRFHFACRAELRDSQIFALLKGKDAKLGAPSPGAIHEIIVEEFKPQLLTFAGNNTSMAELARWLSPMLSRPVVDETGLVGNFSFTLKISPGPRASAPDEPNLPGGFISPQDYVAAVRSLCLTVESRQGKVLFVIVSHVERPSAN